MSEKVQEITNTFSNNDTTSKTQEIDDNNSSSGVSTQDLEEMGIFEDVNYQKLPEKQQIPESTPTTGPYLLSHKLNLDELLEVTQKCKYLPEPTMRRLADLAQWFKVEKKPQNRFQE